MCSANSLFLLCASISVLPIQDERQQPEVLPMPSNVSSRYNTIVYHRRGVDEEQMQMLFERGGGALKLPMHICHAFKWFTNERMRGFVRERATQREGEAFSVRGAFCFHESSQHIDGVGNCVCASSLMIKPGDTTEPLVVWRGGGTEKGEMMMMMMMITMINVFLIFFLFVNTFYKNKQYITINVYFFGNSVKQKHVLLFVIWLGPLWHPTHLLLHAHTHALRHMLPFSHVNKQRPPLK